MSVIVVARDVIDLPADDDRHRAERDRAGEARQPIGAEIGDAEADGRRGTSPRALGGRARVRQPWRCLARGIDRLCRSARLKSAAQPAYRRRLPPPRKRGFPCGQSPRHKPSAPPATPNRERPAEPQPYEASKDELLEFYKQMLLIRRFEEKAGQLYGLGLIGGFCHLYIGQEAVAVGLQSALDGEKDSGDHRLSRPRPHARSMASTPR